VPTTFLCINLRQVEITQNYKEKESYNSLHQKHFFYAVVCSAMPSGFGLYAKELLFK